MTRLMTAGASWSGRERNCCFLNTTDGRFADASAVSGLDFIDDGRSLVATDWDGDGDVDLWFKNRTGPQLRFMRNDLPSGNHYISLKLIGTRCNRDAVGARVEVYAGDKRFGRSVVAGDGYLAQSSKRLHFGLGPLDKIDRIVVNWPGGEAQEFSGVAVDRAYVIEQGSSKPAESEKRTIRLAPGRIEQSPRPGAARVVLRQPLPLPPSLTTELFGPANGRARLLNLWAQWCAPCLGELSELAAQHGRLHKGGLDILAVSVDKPSDRRKAERIFAEQITPKMTGPGFESVAASDGLLETLAAVHQHVVGRAGEISLPSSFLIDPSGMLQALYLGPVGPQTLLADMERYVSSPVPAHRRSYYSGRWYYHTPRNLETLMQDLKNRGRGDDAYYYLSRAVERLKKRKAREGQRP